MSLRRVRLVHRTSSLIAALGLFFLTATGLVLLHPDWVGRAAESPTVVVADPWVAGRLLRAGPFLLEESLDGGITWRGLPLHLAPAVPVAFGFTRDAPHNLWLLGEQEFLFSGDGGRVWDPISLPEGISFNEPARDLTVAADGKPIVTSERGAWLLEDGNWSELWHVPRSRPDRFLDWIRRFHAGHWGPAWMVRLHDLFAVATLLATLSGAGLLVTRNGLNGNKGRNGRNEGKP